MAKVKVDVAHTAIERGILCVAQRIVFARLGIAEMKDILGVWPFIAGSVICEDKNRAFLSVADETDTTPKLNGIRKTIGAFRNIENAVVMRFDQLVDCLLQSGSIVADAVGASAEGFRCKHHRYRIVGLCEKD